MSELETIISRIPYFWYLLSGASICVCSIAMIGLAKSVPFLMRRLIRIQHSKKAVLIIIDFLISVAVVERLFFRVAGMDAFWVSSLLALLILPISQLTLPSSHHCLLVRRDKYAAVGGGGGWTKTRFLGYSPHKKCWVIVKVPVDDNIRYLQRFAREILVMYEVIHHPNCSQIIADGRNFITMRYIPGVDLYSWGRESMKNASSGELEHTLVRIGICACEGLSALYDRGVLAHRDIAPDNILVHINEGELNAIVIDYGTVKVDSKLMVQLEKLLEERRIPSADDTEGLKFLGKPFFRCEKLPMYAVEIDDIRSLARSLSFPAIERLMLSERDRYKGIIRDDGVNLEALEEYIHTTDSFEDILAESVRSQDFRNMLVAAERGEYKTMRDFQSALKGIVMETEEAETPELATPAMKYGHHNKSIASKSISITSLLRRAGVIVSLAIVPLLVYALMSFTYGNATEVKHAASLFKMGRGASKPTERTHDGGKETVHASSPDKPGETKETETTTHEVSDSSEAKTLDTKLELPEITPKEEDKVEHAASLLKSEQLQPEPSYWRLVFGDAAEYSSVKVLYGEREIKPTIEGQIWEFRIPNDASSVKVYYEGYWIVIPESSADTLYLRNYFPKSAQGPE